MLSKIKFRHSNFYRPLLNMRPNFRPSGNIQAGKAKEEGKGVSRENTGSPFGLVDVFILPLIMLDIRREGSSIKDDCLMIRNRRSTYALKMHGELEIL
jgi:hypothetical protein